MRVGLVLGAGGAFGWAFHLGVLEAVREVAHCEPENAERIVGTSAGGAIAATLLAGASTNDVLATITRPPDPEDMERFRAAAAEFRKPWRRFRPVAPGLLFERGLRGTATSLVGLLPAGVFPTDALRRFPAPEGDWPSNLWMPSVRLDDGELVVFGRDRTDIDLADAIEATAAVPGMFQPKTIGTERYVDGAVRSATHADLLTSHELDIAVISSPMTRPGRGVVRSRARRQLADERSVLQTDGVRSIVIEPDAGLVELAAGYPRTNHEAGPTIVAAARDLGLAALQATVAM